MSMDAKMSFIGQLEKKLGQTLTMEQMNEVTAAAMSTLDHFEMAETIHTAESDDMLECYIAAMQVECRSEKTIARYKYVIKRLMNFVKVPTRNILVYHLRNYIASEKARGIADSTLEGYRQIYSAYFNWLQREGLITRNPTANLGTIKVAKKERKTFTAVELEKLNQACKTLRDRAILNFLASTGCRVSEVTELNRDSVDMERLECVVHGKGNKERRVYMSEVTGMLLKNYLDSRKDWNAALFVGRFGERLQPGGVRTMLNVLAKTAGVEHVHPHKFRRTLATEMTRHGMPIQEAARILGHEKLDTTMRYVNQNNDDVKASYRRYA